MEKAIVWFKNLGWFKDKDGKRYKKVYEDLYIYMLKKMEEKE